jgi:molybdopterin synthase catalytic subunit
MIRSSSFHPAVEDKVTADAAGTSPAEFTIPVAGDDAVSAEPLDLVGMLAAAHHPGAGAVVLFSGEVRNHNRGREVAFLEYEAYRPLASKLIGEVLAAAREKWSLQIAVARHRVGKVAIGDTAVVVITASSHRSEAYAANRYIIDRIKQEAPIWKCEHYTDGTQEWGNNCNCHL